MDIAINPWLSIGLCKALWFANPSDCQLPLGTLIFKTRWLTVSTVLSIVIFFGLSLKDITCFPCSTTWTTLWPTLTKRVLLKTQHRQVFSLFVKTLLFTSFSFAYFCFWFCCCAFLLGLLWCHPSPCPAGWGPKLWQCRVALLLEKCSSRHRYRALHENTECSSNPCSKTAADKAIRRVEGPG